MILRCMLYVEDDNVAVDDYIGGFLFIFFLIMIITEIKNILFSRSVVDPIENVIVFSLNFFYFL